MSARSKITGTWELMSWTAVNVKDGKDVTHPYTDQLRGNIIYSSDGYMASMLQHPDVPTFTPGPLLATPEEYQKAGEYTHGYHGKFYLEEKPDGEIKLYHQMIISLPVNWTEQTQVRLCKIWEEDGNLFMMLAPEFTMKDNTGVDRKVELKWRKREANDRTTPP